jgi:hypothetical protein
MNFSLLVGDLHNSSLQRLWTEHRSRWKLIEHFFQVITNFSWQKLITIRLFLSVSTGGNWPVLLIITNYLMKKKLFTILFFPDCFIWWKNRYSQYNIFLTTNILHSTIFFVCFSWWKLNSCSHYNRFQMTKTLHKTNLRTVFSSLFVVYDWTQITSWHGQLI